MRSRARAPLRWISVVRIRHVTLVIRRVEVDSIPALRELNLQPRRITDGTDWNRSAHTPAGVAAIPVDEFLRRRRGLVARDHSQPHGEWLNDLRIDVVTSLVVENALVRNLYLAGSRIEDRRCPVSGAIQGSASAARVSAAGNARRRGVRADAGVAEEDVQVRCTRLTWRHDRIIECKVGNAAGGAERTAAVGDHRAIAGRAIEWARY